ncbi:MAG: hypothetical protein H6Q25_933 [Bacteroidetes bacterium]|nr:hypothetical protein [Bacteroidota bacterium]
MKCLNKLEMQLFIDDALSSEKKKNISLHIEHCQQCSELYNNTLQDKNLIFKALSYLDSDFTEQEIPEFKKYSVQKKSNRFQIFKIAASIIILIGLGFIWQIHQNKQMKKNTLLQAQYDLLEKEDQNKTWHKKQIDVVITDAEGNFEGAFTLEN